MDPSRTIPQSEKRDELDAFLARTDNKKEWRTVHDDYNDEDIVLSKEEVTSRSPLLYWSVAFLSSRFQYHPILTSFNLWRSNDACVLHPLVLGFGGHFQRFVTEVKGW